MLLMWLEIVWLLRLSWRAISWLLAPLARSLKICSSRSVRAARIALAAPSGVVATGMSSSRIRSSSLPAICGERMHSLRRWR